MMKSKKTEDSRAHPLLTIEHPETADGPELWKLVAETEVLDRNSLYAYLLLGSHFSRTCIAAKSEGRLVGAVTGYLPPERADTLFVWQVAVHADQRGKGLASRMLDRLLERLARRGVRYLETTVSPSNTASVGMFRKLAARWQAPLEVGPGFPGSLFRYQTHEAEPLYRIGPLGKFP